jgi:hypothetical protein
VLHDVWFWIAAVEGFVILAAVAFFVWALKTMPPAPPRMTGFVRGTTTGSFELNAQIGHQTGEVLMAFDKSIVQMSVTPPDARYMAKIFAEAADCAEGHIKPVNAPKELRPTAWDRLRRD